MTKCFAVFVLVVASLTMAGDFLLRPVGYVNDSAGIIPESDRASLETTLRNYEKESSIEIAVATVSSLDGLDVSDYTTHLFEVWGVGKKGLDNGILIVLAPNEKKWTIRTGYGMEPYLTDARARSIGEAAVSAHRGDYPKIIAGMVGGIIEKLGIVSWEQREEFEKKIRAKEGARKQELLTLLLYILPVLAFLGILIGVVSHFVGAWRKRVEDERAAEERKRRAVEAEREAPARMSEVEKLLVEAKEKVARDGVSQNARQYLRGAKESFSEACGEAAKSAPVDWLLVASLLLAAHDSATTAIERSDRDLAPPPPPPSRRRTSSVGHEEGGGSDTGSSSRARDEDSYRPSYSPSSRSGNGSEGGSFGGFGGGMTGGGGASGNL